MKTFVHLGWIAATFALGCTCGNKQATPGSASEASVSGGPSSSSSKRDLPARFSAPIAAARVGGAVLAAGLVVPSKSVAVTRLELNGRTAWTSEVLSGVAWSSDAELRVHPAGDGAAVVWRGTRDGKRVRQLVFVGADGALRGQAIDIGAASCATSEHVAWIERGETGASRVRGRRSSNGAIEDLLAVHKEREALLLCTDKRVYALGEGEDDAELVAAQGGGPWTVLREHDYTGDDELREHLEYVAGDDVGILRLTHAGAVHFREVRGGTLTPWKKLPIGIPRDDDVVAVEATTTTVAAVHTRDELDSCGPDLHGVSVHSLRFDRKQGEASRMQLSPASCGKELGPFWIGRVGERIVVAWAERPSKRGKTNPSLEGLAYRVIDGEKAAETKRVAQSADALVEAGCDAAGCVFVALARTAGESDALPTPLVLVRVPEAGP
jgi:hypothetical protein